MPAQSRHHQQGAATLLFLGIIILVWTFGKGATALMQHMESNQRLNYALESAAVGLYRAQSCEPYIAEQLLAAYYGDEWGDEVQLASLSLAGCSVAANRYEVQASITTDSWLNGFSPVTKRGLESEEVPAENLPPEPGQPASDIVGIEVTAVIDISSSMSGAPIRELRNVLEEFVDRLEVEDDADNNRRLDNTRLSIVPFSGYVAFNADGVPTMGGSRVCYRGDPSASTNYTRRDWDDMMSQQQAGEFPDERATIDGFNSCSSQMQAHYLTDNLTFIRDNLATLDSTGTTSIELGLVWGWRTLDPRWKINVPVANQADLYGRAHKILILFSDADGISRTPMVESGSSEHDSICGAMDRQRIDVFTVLLGAGGSSALRDCASEPEYYQRTADPAAIIETFEKVLEVIREKTAEQVEGKELRFYQL